jgi:hypothetical protein
MTRWVKGSTCGAFLEGLSSAESDDGRPDTCLPGRIAAACATQWTITTLCHPQV